MVSVFVLLLCFLTFANSEILTDQNSDNIDPVKQTSDEAEPSDQSKRTLFDSGNAYGIEKHVRLLPSGYKYLLGYRPVKLQLVPIARPMYIKPVTHWKSPNLHFSAKPVVTLLPPKTVPVFKSSNRWKYEKLPVNVPPSVPLKPWQQEGWTPLTKDTKPFVPSVPLPQSETAVASSQSPIIPIIPTSIVPTAPVFPVTSPSIPYVPSKPLVPIAPVPNLNTVFPVQAPPVVISGPVQPAVHINPINPSHNINFNIAGRHLVPINYLPGKLNVPVPDLGVLPLRSTVPVQASVQVQAPTPFVHKLSPPFVLPDQHFLPKLPFPISVTNPAHTIQPFQHTIPQPVHSVLPQPVIPQHIQPVLPHHVQHIVPQHIPPILPQHVQPGIPHPVLPDQAPQPIPESPPQPLPHPHIHIISHQSPGQQNIQLPEHNYQYFAQNGETQFHQEIAPQQFDQSYHYDPPQQQELQEPQGFFQPGKTDLQIPGYLPEHPHIRQTFTPSQHDPNFDPQNAK